MNNHLHVFLCLPFLLVLPCSGLAQTESPDSTAFETIMENSFKELEESNYDEDVQRKYARIFHQYYLDHPNGKHGEWALATAFKLWGRMGAVNKAEQAMAQLDSDAEVWSYFLAFVPNVYANSEERTIEDAVTLFEKLTNKLTHPKSKSRAYWWLASYYHGQKDIENLKRVSRAMINLDAIEIHVNQGLGYLYEVESLNIDQEAPRFQAKTVQGKPISLPQNDKIVLLEFWATWCGPCMPEIPHLKSLRSEYSNDNLLIVGISLDTDPEKLKQFIQDRDMGWPQIIQAEEWSGEIVKLYNVSGIPRTYIIGREGKIVAKDLRGEELEKEIAKLMNQ